MTNSSEQTVETLPADIGSLLRELETIATTSKPIGHAEKEPTDDLNGASMTIRGK